MNELRIYRIANFVYKMAIRLDGAQVLRMRKSITMNTELSRTVILNLPLQEPVREGPKLQYQFPYSKHFQKIKTVSYATLMKTVTTVFQKNTHLFHFAAVFTNTDQFS